MNTAGIVGSARHRADPRISAALAVSTLALVGYLGLANAQVSAAVVGAIALAAWSAFASGHARTAIGASFVFLLVAGTKFRLRDADASLARMVDAQIVLELALFAAVGVGLLAVWKRAAIEHPHRPPRLGGTEKDQMYLRVSVSPWPVTAIEALLCSYVLIAGVSALWSLAPALTLVRATQLAIVAGLAVTAVRVLRPSAALHAPFLAAAAYALGCAALAAIFPWAAPAYVDDYARYAWFAVHPIEAGTLAAIGALGCLVVCLFPNARGASVMPRLQYGLSGSALVAVLMLTKSRGPLLALVAGVGTLMLLRARPAARFGVLLIGAVSMLTVAAVQPNLRPWLDSLDDRESAITRLIFRGQTADTVMELNGRLELWDDLTPAIAAQPIGGYGYQASRPVMLDAASWAAYAHNALLQTVLDLGVLGTAALLSLIIAGLSAGMNRALDLRARAAIVPLMVFLVVNSVTTEGFAGAPGLEALLLFTCALCAATRHDDSGRS